MSKTTLGEFEHFVLLAILRLGRDAYGPLILDEIAARTEREPSAGSLYVTLDRLEQKGLIASRLADATHERGGRPRRYVRVTAAGLTELRAQRRALISMWRGLEGDLGKA